ncbi:glycosyltransferase family 39 protein [Cerasicoccus arenae]|uniref:Glycosyl transferase n=1 Tax=Cerasicoccus arenae TaxID=424488 RepID=A0A8J3GCZ3_9BACT|nr:glycosyltransferase family 39 protein [Cerasicoccus arenae]MBK1857980.1 glycosyltransferase family 39 protein [Cerasicoccus arenae]GHB97688.1 glycosyl transferase [Cerasicoccus arenae]
MHLPESTRSLRQDLALLALFFGVLFFGTTWVRPLGNPDEGRYSEIPREMVDGGDWILPRLNGVLYFYKPPLPYWLHASAITVGGHSLWVLRFWPAAISLLGVLGTYLAARHFYGRLAGVFGALILGTSLLFFGLSQVITLDPFVSVFMTLGLYAYLVGLYAPPGNVRRWLFAGFYTGISLAVMSKGFMAIAIPGAIIFLWFLVLNEWRRLRDLHLVMGAVIFLIIVGPWHLAAALANPNWFDFYVIHEHFDRYLHDVSDRTQPFWYFLVLLPIGLLPWTIFLPQTLIDVVKSWGERRERPASWFLLIWAAFVVVFFSLSQSKLPTYILPAMPPLAILMGRYVALRIEERRWEVLRPAIWWLAGLLLVLALVLPVLAWVRSDDMTSGATPWIIVAALMLIVSGGVAIRFLRKKEEALALLTAFAGVVLTLLCFNGLAAQFQQPGTRAFAEFLKPKLQPGDRVYHFADYFQDFPFYLGQPVDLLMQFPNEQTFGVEWEPDQASRYIVDQADIPAAWSAPERQFALAHAEHLPIYQQLFPDLPVYVWMADPNYVLFSNRPMENEPH